MTRSTRWRRSSRSQSGSTCVELAHTLSAVRDSKNPSVTLVVPTAAFIASIKVVDDRFAKASGPHEATWSH